ncbi:hypothetical protein [[Eubacterium] cellulosolvens]
MKGLNSIKDAKSFVESVFEDEILLTLLNNSNLTRKQFESLIIDFSLEKILDDNLTMKHKTRLRTDRKNLSRGAFLRTLSQAKMNVVRSLYTIFLLGYVGILDNLEFEPFIEISQRIKSHVENLEKEEDEENYAKAIKVLSDELSEIIDNLAKSKF